MKGNSPLFNGARYGRATSGDISYMGTGDSSEFAKNISKRLDIDVNGNFDVIAHGGTTYMNIESAGITYQLSSREAAKLIRKAPGFRKSKSVRLFSCNTGVLNNGFAQNLANALGKPVYAPNNFVWAYPSGKHFVAGRLKNGRPDYRDIGKFIKFVPGGNRNGK